MHSLNDPTIPKRRRNPGHSPGWRDRSAMPLILFIVICVGLGGVLTSCGSKGVEQFKDAPVGQRNTGKADLITFPDGFSNVAAKCDGPNRVYVIFKGDNVYGSIAVAPNDPQCK